MRTQFTLKSSFFISLDFENLPKKVFYKPREIKYNDLHIRHSFFLTLARKDTAPRIALNTF